MNEMTGLLPPATFIAWTLAVQHIRSRATPASLRMSAMVAVVLLSAALAVATELLSLFHAISFWPVLLFWLAALAAALPLAAKAWPHTKVRLQRIQPHGKLEWVLCVLVLLILAAAFLISRFYPPQTHDTLTYHLPRQVIWWQQASVEHFDSGKLRNLIMPPLAEFVGLHLMVLTHDDFWHTSIQWFYLLTGVGAVSSIVRRAGGSRNSQWLAALFVVSSPVVFLEASSVKNDIIVGVFLIIFVALGLFPLGKEKIWSRTSLLGLTLGLAMLTKGTAYILFPPILIWICWRFLRTYGSKSVLPLAAMFLIAASLNLGHWTRNYQFFGSILNGSRSEADHVMVNESHSPTRMLSVISRNVAALSITQFDSVNQCMEQAVQSLHHAMNLSVDDAATTYDPAFRIKTDNYYREEWATSILHNIVIFGAMIAAIILYRRRSVAAKLALCILAGFFLFSVYLKWQPWHARLLLPLIFLAGPMIALVLPQRGLRSIVSHLTAAILLLASITPFFFLGTRPLFAATVWTHSREERRYPPRNERVLDAARAFAEIIRGQPNLHHIGIVSHDVDEIDYVMMKALLDHTPHPLQFHYVNPLIHVPGYTTAPAEALVSMGGALHITETSSNRRFSSIACAPPYSLYLPDEWPDLNAVSLIVQGKIAGAKLINDQGLAAAFIEIESVLRGPADMRQIAIITYANKFYANHVASPVQCRIGDRGIWLLKSTPIAGIYMVETAQYLRPDSDLPELLKRLK